MSDPASCSGDMPLVSVVIPCYNVAPYVEAAVVSALEQTWPRLEVIAVVDGATDETLSVLNRLAATRQDERLRIVCQPNGGLSDARNSGIREAGARYIAFLDGDDIWLPEKVECQMQAMLSDPRVGLTFSFSRYLNEAGGDTGRLLTTRKLRPGLRDMIKRNHFGNGSTVIARRECFEAAGVFATELKSCEDYELWCRILSKTSYLAAGVPRALTCYRLRESSLTFDPYKFTQNADLAMRHIRERIDGIPERVLRAGHAMHYRIAAWRALLAGRDAVARDLMANALRLWPPLVLCDPRTPVVLAAMVMPRQARSCLSAAAHQAHQHWARLSQALRLHCRV
jgi:glycosyltransferase involved in cell wall biosynthesis